MEYDLYYQSMHAAAEYAAANENDSAIQIFTQLLSKDISERDKAIICVNLAKIHHKLGDSSEALKWYDQAIQYEEPYFRSFAAESKAAYLAEIGQAPKSLALYEKIALQPYLDEAEKYRIRTNMNILKQQLSGGSSISN